MFNVTTIKEVEVVSNNDNYVPQGKGNTFSVLMHMKYYFFYCQLYLSPP